MRKAGGTSLRRYFNEYSEITGIKFEAVEGYSLDPKNLLRRNIKKLLVTSLRDPIQRIKSSYRFEGRWEQNDQNPSIDTMKSFSTWVAENRCNNDNNFLWVCTENYYVKSLIGYPRIGQNGIGIRELELAKENLRKFDIVLITELLSDPHTTRYLKKHFQFDREIPKCRYPELPRPETPDNEIFDENTLTWLRELNQLDIKLYQTARSLFEKQIGGRGGLNLTGWLR